MKPITDTAKRLSRTFDLKSHRNGYAVSIAVALLIASILLGVYYVLLRPEQKGYTSIYLLDSQKKAINYPELLVNGENNTFSVYVEVENHMAKNQNCTVKVKVTSDMNPTFPVYGVDPVKIYNETVKNEETWETTATTSIDQVGNHLVVFELWISDDNGILQFSQNFCVLNVQVTEKVIT